MKQVAIDLYQGDCLEILKNGPDNSIDALVTDPPAGISFMGKEWDSDKGGRDGWVTWLTGVMRECYRVLKPGAHGLVWALPRTSHWTATALENAGFDVRDVVMHLFGTGFPKSLDISKAIDKMEGAERTVIGTGRQYANEGGAQERRWEEGTTNKNVSITTPATDAAKQWQGWGTALKPAAEHWILIRKPLSEPTVAKNVIKYGTAGLNIDACRIESGHDYHDLKVTQGGADCGVPLAPARVEPRAFIPAQGRFPSNHVLDEEAAKVLGEPSRFFYVAKAAKSEKNAGLEEREEQIVDDGRQTPIDNPFLRGKTGRKNTHPTVKSIALMRYLIRLITPPGGIVLDCFMGSGSTGVAAIEEGFNFIGIEQMGEYFQIAQARVEHAQNSVPQASVGGSK